MYPYFDRYDVILAHLILEYDYNVSGVLQERPSNKRRKMSTGYQVHRMIPNFTRRDLYPEFFANDNAKAIYHELVKRYDLPVGDFDKRYQVGD